MLKDYNGNITMLQFISGFLEISLTLKAIYKTNYNNNVWAIDSTFFKFTITRMNIKLSSRIFNDVNRWFASRCFDRESAYTTFWLYRSYQFFQVNYSHPRIKKYLYCFWMQLQCMKQEIQNNRKYNFYILSLFSDIL